MSRSELSSANPGPQTVFRGEMYAVLQLARYTEGPIDTTLDCLGVPKRVRSPKPGKPTVTSGGGCKPQMSTASK